MKEHLGDEQELAPAGVSQQWYRVRRLESLVTWLKSVHDDMRVGELESVAAWL